MRRAASMPSSPGIAISSTATSGGASTANATARPESPKLPTTRMSACAASSACRPSRTTAWSSSSRTLISIAFFRHLEHYARAAAGKLDTQAPAVGFSALAHGDKAETAALRALRACRLGKAAAIVLHRKRHAFAVADGDLHVRGAAVLGNVGERLLRDAEYGELGVARKAHRPAGGLGAHLDAGALAEERRMPAQRRHQAELLQRGGPQFRHHAADRVDGGFHQRGHGVQTRAGDQIAARLQPVL